MTRIAVWPVPRPRNVRPGASWLIVPMECAVTGAIRVPAIDTPVPMCMRFVFTAASASVA